MNAALWAQTGAAMSEGTYRQWSAELSSLAVSPQKMRSIVCLMVRIPANAPNVILELEDVLLQWDLSPPSLSLSDESSCCRHDKQKDLSRNLYTLPVRSVSHAKHRDQCVLIYLPLRRRIRAWAARFLSLYTPV